MIVHEMYRNQLPGTWIFVNKFDGFLFVSEWKQLLDKVWLI